MTVPASLMGGLVCLDVDGCLIDSDRPMMAALNQALRSLDLPEVSLADLRPHLGPPLEVTLAGLLEALDADPGLREPLLQRYRGAYAPAAVAQATLYAGIEQALDRLAEDGHRLVVVSSKPPRYARPVLRAVGQLDRFAGVFGPLGAEREPKAETLARALGQVPGRAERIGAVVVGDTVQDVEAAAAHHIPAIAVTWGYGLASELAGARPGAVIDSPEQLPAAVASLLRADD